MSATAVYSRSDPRQTPQGPGPTGISGFQRTNFAIAEAAAGCFLGEVSRLKSEAAVSGLVIHGRLEKIGSDPPVFADVAHNRAGARALASSLPELTGGAPVVGVIGVLSDKDAPGMLAELAGTMDRVIFTGLPEAGTRCVGQAGSKRLGPGGAASDRGRAGTRRGDRREPRDRPGKGP